MLGRSLLILVGDILIGLSFLILAMLIASFAVSVVSDIAGTPETMEFAFAGVLFIEGLALQLKALKWERPLAGLLVSLMSLATAIAGMVIGFILVARSGIDWWLAFLNELIDVSRLTFLAGLFLVIVLILVVAIAVASFEVPAVVEEKRSPESRPSDRRRRTAGTLRRR